MIITITVTHSNGDVIIKAKPFWNVGYIKLVAVERIHKLDTVTGMVMYDLVKDGQPLVLKNKLEECGINDGDVLVLERKHGTVINI